MSARLLLAIVALLALPACLDPIVGTQCAEGYSPCGGKCAPAGSCDIPDAGEEADGEDATLLDGSPGEPEPDVDAEAMETGPEADAEPTVDGDENDAGVEPEDAPLPVEVGEAANAGPDGSGPEVEVDSIPGAGARPDGGGDAVTAIDVPEGDSPLLCVGCLDAADEAGDETGALPEDGGAAEDASRDDAAMADAIEADVGLDDAGPLQCSGDMVICNNQCVDLATDPENCGGCNTMCPSGVCISSGCLVCAAEETVCGQQCINIASDPDHCGGCSAPCASGLCSNSHCEASGTGRVIVIGHDYLRNRPAMNRILGNAVFLWPTNPVRLLAYKGAANPAAITGADGAIAQVAAATGRQIQLIEVAAADVAAQLAAADVFLIYGQEQASDATLIELGQDWATAMGTFTSRGGTVIVLDAFTSANAGTVQILSQTGLFSIQRHDSVTDSVCTVIARGDALASGLPRTYRCEQNSANFTTTETGPAVTSVVESGTSVVIDKVF